MTTIHNASSAVNGKPSIGQFELKRGVRFAHREWAGTWQVLRDAQQDLDGKFRYACRERVAGALVGPVKRVHWTEVATIQADPDPEPEPAPEAPAPEPEPTAVKPTAAPHLELTLYINGWSYDVKPLEVDPGSEALKGFRLLKLAGACDTAYDVYDTRDGACCDCADWVYRRAGLDPSGCKHIKSLRSLGLLDPAPYQPQHWTDADQKASLAIARGLASPIHAGNPDPEPFTFTDDEELTFNPPAPEPAVTADDDFDLAAGHDGWPGYAEWSASLDAGAEPTSCPPGPMEPTLPFAEWVAGQAAYQRSLNTTAGRWLAAHIDRLAERARFLGADCPATFEDRHQTMLTDVYQSC